MAIAASMASNKNLHITSPITPEEFQPGCLGLFSHTQEEISNAIIKNVSRKGKDLLPRQIDGLARFKYDGSWNLGQPSNERDMKKYFDIFNDVFFNGVLTGFVTLEILEDGWVLQRFGCEVLGYCSTTYTGWLWNPDPRFKQEKPYSHIVIGSQASKKIKTATWKIQQFLQTLPHEMLHAVFHLFTSHCKTGCLVNISWASHHVHWQAAAKAIEDSGIAGDMFLGLNLSWDREVDMAWDTHCGYKLPNDAVLRTLGLDVKEVLRLLDKRREASRAAEDKHRRSWISENKCINRSWLIYFP